MRLITLVVLSLLATQPALAKSTHNSSHQHTTSSQSQSSDLIEQGEYINSNGDEVHSPAHTKSGHVPDGATAKCRDDSYSFSQHHRGTCSRHGGVAEWLS
ncbi:Protein of uncharacterised function (DUF3761) [Serratia proteamaculans]|uniref:DUF3761 domain-containing protein n=1 Tax=Serratia proteamaculans TaxID=28151 RepID=UPI002183D9B0|nr:DUF3761 domain-containing protein [Serratia proteamaculans]CAI2428217.1 Protein of uncharacterised function (DUF3761) [Serratia proteamaculans]